MLSKKKRISRKEFTEAYASLKNLRGSFFYIKANYSTQEELKVSVVVSKKVCKTSVLRHKVKRQVYSVFQKLEKDKKIKGFFIVFIQQKPEISFDCMYTEFSTFF